MQTRTERIKFWLNDKDLKQIERKAKKAGMNRSEYGSTSSTTRPIYRSLCAVTITGGVAPAPQLTI